jgi:hypothetical protein
MDELSGCSSDTADTAVDPVTDEALPTPSAELLSGAPDHNFVRADGQSHVAAKPIRHSASSQSTSEAPSEDQHRSAAERP